MASKERLDLLLVQNGFFESREKARAAIMAGLVFHGTERLEKPGLKLDSATELTVKGAVHPYVSRGGLKLEKALRCFSLDITGQILIDIGASTGGFTDCALQHGANLVYAIDVGYNQLDWSLRNDARVIVMERTNFRHLEPSMLAAGFPELAVIDVSFISLRLILPPLLPMLAGSRQIVALIKPQFEAGREQVGKHGVVRESAVHLQVLSDLLHFASEIGLDLMGLSFSPITGGEGNIEFLAFWQLAEASARRPDPDQIRAVVQEAHQTLRGDR